MEMITNPTNTLAKIQGMNCSDVKKYEKMCQKALKTAKNDVCVVKTKNGEKYITTDALCQILDSLDYRYNVLTQNWDKIHGLFENETANCMSNAGEKNVKKVLHKKSQKSFDKPKKNCYINNTNKTKTTNSNGDKTMITKNEIAKIAPNAVKNILAAQKINKTDTKKTYWGGWGKVRAGMNATYNDYNKFQELENQWAELRAKLGKSAKGHFCWSLINKNRVGVKQEPNATLRFIKNVKIRIAMANDVLAGKYTKTQIDEYMNGLSTAYKLKYGLV